MRLTTMLYVHRDFVGRDIPFDKMYFFHKDDEADIPRVFSNAFVLPLNQQLVAAVERVLHLSAEREKEHAPASGEYTLRYNARGYDRLGTAAQKKKDEVIKHNIVKILRERGQYSVLVPVLFTKQFPKRHVSRLAPQQTENLLYPQYLVASGRRKSDDTAALAAKMIGARAYFIHRGKVYRPLCLLCPRSIDSVVGECTFGKSDCFLNLGYIGESDFTRGVQAYRKLVNRIDEPAVVIKEAH